MHKLTVTGSLLAVYAKLKGVSAACAASSGDERENLIEQAQGIIFEICRDHVAAVHTFVRKPELKEAISQKIRAECQELIEYIMAAKRFNLEINSRAKDRVISFGERLACIFMTALLEDVVGLATFRLHRLP